MYLVLFRLSSGLSIGERREGKGGLSWPLRRPFFRIKVLRIPNVFNEVSRLLAGCVALFLCPYQGWPPLSLHLQCDELQDKWSP